MRYTEDGTPVTNFSVATRQVVSKERVASCPTGWKESLNGKNWELTTWFRVTAWRKLAETCNQFLTKGKQVMVEGELSEPKPYQKRDGTWGASLDVTAYTVKFLGSRDDSAGPAAASYDDGAAGGVAIEDEEIPF